MTPSAYLLATGIEGKTASDPEPVLLIIADISGYTRFMTANAKTLAHSQAIITELVSTIVKEVELPLEVAKLEGDAVFLYCRKNTISLPWPQAQQLIGKKLFNFFSLFGDKVSELSRSSTCSCSACTHLDRLRLKVIVHSGEALFHRVLQFTELAGVDVIVVHRLLKNSVAEDQYLLVTEVASREVEFPPELTWINSQETYKGIGRVPTRIYLPNPSGNSGQTEQSAGSNLKRQFSTSWGLFRKLWFNSMRFDQASRSHGFRHIDGAPGPIRRTGFALFTLVLTPLFMPVGALLSLLHALAVSDAERSSKSTKPGNS